MLDCLNKVVDRIDTFQEDCAKMIFALRHLLGEDQTVNENDLYLTEEEGDLRVYRNKDLVLTYNEEGMIAAPKFATKGKILKEASKLVKKNLKENASPDQGVDGQELGGKMEEAEESLMSKIAAYVKKNPTNPKDAVKKMALTIGADEEEVEDALYQLAVAKLSGKMEENSVADMAVNPNGLEEKPKKKLVKEALFKVNAYNDMSGATTGTGVGTSPNAAKQQIGASAKRPGVTIGKVQEV